MRKPEQGEKVFSMPLGMQAFKDLYRCRMRTAPSFDPEDAEFAAPDRTELDLLRIRSIQVPHMIKACYIYTNIYCPKKEYQPSKPCVTSLGHSKKVVELFDLFRSIYYFVCIVLCSVLGD